MENEGYLQDIHLECVSKRYRDPAGKDLEVLENLTLTVYRGELLVLLGPSGCGKSTILRIMSRAEMEDSGVVTVEPIRAESSASIEQVPALLPWRTAFQNAHLGTEIRAARLRARAWKAPLDSSAMRQKIHDDLRLFRLNGFENSYPQELSGGMQQRVAVIRALQSEPRILYCDEPFSAIDFPTRLYLNTLFKKTSRQIGCTTVFVTHNIEEAIFLADRILVFSKRPCRIVDEIMPHLTRSPEDAVKCREAPEFPILFSRIWKALEVDG